MISKTVYTVALVILIGSLTSCDGERLGSSRIEALLTDTRMQHTDDDQLSADLEDIATELANGDLSGLRESLNYLRDDVANEEMKTNAYSSEETSDEEIASEQVPPPDNIPMSRTIDTTVNIDSTEGDFLMNMNSGGTSDLDGDSGDEDESYIFGGAPTPEQERAYMEEQNTMEDTEEEYNYEEIPVSSPDE